MRELQVVEVVGAAVCDGQDVVDGRALTFGPFEVRVDRLVADAADEEVAD